MPSSHCNGLSRGYSFLTARVKTPSPICVPPTTLSHCFRRCCFLLLGLLGFCWRGFRLLLPCLDGNLANFRQSELCRRGRSASESEQQSCRQRTHDRLANQAPLTNAYGLSSAQK